MDAELETMLPKVTEEVKQAMGDSLAALLLYGSSVGGGYKPGQSNVNLMAVQKALDLGALRRLAPVVSRWAEEVVVIHVTSIDELQASARVFPIHLLELQDHNKLLAGADPLAGIAVEPTDLLASTERELREVTRSMRRALLLFGEERRGLGGAIRKQFRSLVYALRGLLRVVSELPATTDKHPTLERAAKRFGLDHEVMLSLLSFRRRLAMVTPNELQDLAEGLLLAATKAADAARDLRK